MVLSVILKIFQHRAVLAQGNRAVVITFSIQVLSVNNFNNCEQIRCKDFCLDYRVCYRFLKVTQRYPTCFTIKDFCLDYRVCYRF